MAKFTCFEFDPVIYPYKFWVAKDGTKADVKDMFVDAEHEEIVITDSDIKRSAALTFDPVIAVSDGQQGVFTWLHTPEAVTTGTIAHEADHAANAVFDFIGASVDPKNDEPHAYLIGFFADCIDEVLKRKS